MKMIAKALGNFLLFSTLANRLEGGEIDREPRAGKVV